MPVSLGFSRVFGYFGPKHSVVTRPLLFCLGKGAVPLYRPYMSVNIVEQRRMFPMGEYCIYVVPRRILY